MKMNLTELDSIDLYMRTTFLKVLFYIQLICDNNSH